MEPRCLLTTAFLRQKTRHNISLKNSNPYTEPHENLHTFATSFFITTKMLFPLKNIKILVLIEGQRLFFNREYLGKPEDPIYGLQSLYG